MRNRWKELEERRLYRQFIAKGNLVLDVGANIGQKTKTFLALGAHVVAVEPNPDCEDILRRRCLSAVEGGLLDIVSCAIGARSGRLALSIDEKDSSKSSGSTAFIEACNDVTWHKIDVEMVTLNDLILRFGAPNFIKVDVEGMDADVLQGLTHRPKFLSFEYNLHPNLWPNTKRSLQEATRLGFTEAKFTELGSARLLPNVWVPLAMAEAAITGHCTGHEWGDVFVR